MMMLDDEQVAPSTSDKMHMVMLCLFYGDYIMGS